MEPYQDSLQLELQTTDEDGEVTTETETAEDGTTEDEATESAEDDG